jgi:pimeloyl-ACP methyl ester carboxylesterase
MIKAIWSFSENRGFIEGGTNAIHGEYDPHPIDGVKLSLQNKFKDFIMYTLRKCGHSPWKEKHAYQEFYEILRKELEE